MVHCMDLELQYPQGCQKATVIGRVGEMVAAGEMKGRCKAKAGPGEMGGEEVECLEADELVSWFAGFFAVITTM